MLCKLSINGYFLILVYMRMCDVTRKGKMIIHFFCLSIKLLLIKHVQELLFLGLIMFLVRNFLNCVILPTHIFRAISDHKQRQ
jgi:hypothetical protein